MLKRKNKFFQDLDYLTSQDINDNKITYDKLVRINPYFEKDKAFTYSILLKERDDLDQETREQMQKYIEKSRQDEQMRLKRYLDIMETKKYEQENI